MAKMSEFDAALAKIDADIADLQRARDIMTQARVKASVEAKHGGTARKPRTRKRGLPAQDTGE